MNFTKLAYIIHYRALCAELKKQGRLNDYKVIDVKCYMNKEGELISPIDITIIPKMTCKNHEMNIIVAPNGI